MKYKKKELPESALYKIIKLRIKKILGKEWKKPKITFPLIEGKINISVRSNIPHTDSGPPQYMYYSDTPHSDMHTDCPLNEWEEWIT